MDCHLLIPGLVLPENAGAAPYDDLALPALETLLARGTLRTQAGASLERWLATAFHVEPQYDLPLAPLSLRGDGVEPGDAFWVQADPVHLEVRRDALLLADASCLEITADEADDIVSALNAHFRGEGLEFLAPAPQRWYARLAAEARIRTTPTLEVAGRGIERFLPAGDDARRWRRLANEAQMLLHQHGRNAAREARGALTLNSVWFWGAGRLPPVGAGAPFTAVWSSYPLATGLAAEAGLKTLPAPPSAAAFLEGGWVGPGARRELIVLDPLRGAASADLAAWRGTLARLEESWFAPLLEAVKRGAVELTFHALGAERSLAFTSTRLDGLKFWRTRQPVARHLAAVSR